MRLKGKTGGIQRLEKRAGGTREVARTRMGGCGGGSGECEGGKTEESSRNDETEGWIREKNSEEGSTEGRNEEKQGRRDEQRDKRGPAF